MNIRCGLFRLWLVLCALWAITVAAVSFGDVREEFKHAAANAPPATLTVARLRAPKTLTAADIDLLERLARLGVFQSSKPTPGRPPAGYIEDPPAPRIDEFEGVEYEFPADATDAEVAKFLSSIRPARPARPWSVLGEKAALAGCLPLGVLAFGWALMWALAGFRTTAHIG